MPVIAMTANASGEDRAQCIAAGMDDYISQAIHEPYALCHACQMASGEAANKCHSPSMFATLPAATTRAGDQI